MIIKNILEPKQGNIQQTLIETKTLAKKINREIKIMGLCGTHSQTIARYNIKNLLPKNIKLVSGPGCPVCVTDQKDIDIIVGLALHRIPIATYGDVITVPGNLMSLEEARRKGADINVVYSTLEALELKKQKPNLVFFGIGFETTAPMSAWAIKNGLIVYSVHKIFPPAMKTLLENKKIKIDGFINPGHVSAIIGENRYHQFKFPQVIAGFESGDVIIAVKLLLEQINKNECKVENEYKRVVKPEGNKKAKTLINEVFEIIDADWRGIGTIRKSGLEIRKRYIKQNAKIIYKKLIKKIISKIKIKPSGCRCGEVLQGLIEPKECSLFGKICSPENPCGPCMVSIEGSCNIEYRYNPKPNQK